jgi:hypothetical protein
MFPEIKPDPQDYDTTCPVCGNKKTFVGDFAGGGYFACDHCEGDPPASETDDIHHALVKVQAARIKQLEATIEALEHIVTSQHSTIAAIQMRTVNNRPEQMEQSLDYIRRMANRALSEYTDALNKAGGK